MASRFFRPSRLIAIALVIAAGAWIVSGSFGQQAQENGGAAAPGETPAAQVPVQRVAVQAATAEEHRRQVVLSCVTKADHRAQAVARASGVIVQLLVSRGDTVRSGDPIAYLSDEGRQAAVLQAQSLLDQRRAEYDANKQLIEQGNAPKNQLPALEAAVAAAKAALASAQAEAQKGTIKSPIGGVVDAVPVQVGQAVQIGTEIAAIVDPDPMLAVGAVSESRRNSLAAGQKASVRFIDGSIVDGVVDFVGVSADAATRTYPVEATMRNPDAAIADGLTCEMSVMLAPIEATAVPRSALVFSDDGHLGVRIANADSKVEFKPVQIVEDGLQSVWVTGLSGSTRVIVVGQDFVKEGDPVEAVSAAAISARPEPPA